MRVSVCLLVILIAAIPAGAQTQPWCSDPLLQPYPAPKWSELPGSPNFETVSENFRVGQSLRVVISVLEKAIAESKSGDSKAGNPNADGVCLCNCSNKDAAYWAEFLKSTVTTRTQEALQKTEDRYLSDVQGKIEEARKALFDAVPGFKSDVAKIVDKTCVNLKTCDAQNPLTAYQQLGETAQGELDKIFGPQLTLANLQKLLDEARKLRDDSKKLMEKIAASDGPRSMALISNQDAVVDIITRTANLYRDLEATTKALATLVKNGDPAIWKLQVEKGLTAKLDALFTNDVAVWQAMQTEIRAKLDARLAAIKDAATAIYTTATDGQAVLDEFGKELASGLLADLQSMKGCYGVTKRDQCTTGAFCSGTSAGKLFGSDDLELPLWMPTSVFKDGKSALRWAFATLSWLEKLQKQVEAALGAKPGASQKMLKVVQSLKNAQEVLDTINTYADRFTDGFHLGAYSDIRPDLHACVGYAGHGVMAELVSSPAGNFRGGAEYLSANLSEDYASQFRAAGFGLFINGRHLPLLPSVEANLQLDGFRLFHESHLFGIDAKLIGDKQITQAEVKKYDVFSMVNCCKTTDPKEICVHCPITATSQIYTPRYPVRYASGGLPRVWPRTGVAWEKDERIASVLGTGLNLKLEAKTHYWSATPIPLFPGASVTPWMSLGAGVEWFYGANKLRKTMQDQLNRNLPSNRWLSVKDFDRNMHHFQAPDVTEDLGNAAHVNPKLGADLVLGIDLARWLRLGVTASLNVAVDVDASGNGGVLDLNRQLVETLKASNPQGTDCRPKIAENVSRTCSNEQFKKKDPCANVPAAERKDCIDHTPPAPVGTLFSTGVYNCDTCDTRGYCVDAKGTIVAHDVTRAECEAETQLFSCVATYRENPNGDGAAVGREEFNVDLSPPFSMTDKNGHRAAQLAQAQAVATPLITQDRCTAQGWCWNWAHRPDVGGTTFPYVAVYNGVASARSACPPARYASGKTILLRGTATPLLSQFIRFEWRPSGPAPDPVKVGRVWRPYQCTTTARPQITGYEGNDCNPLQFGYPSVCPDKRDCACDPKAPACAAGRVCIDGACAVQCDPARPCPAGFVCQGGGCVLANKVPFAEQVIWRMRNAAQPQHTVATYGLDKVVTSAAAGLGLRVGMDYKLFKNWKNRNLLDFSKVIPLVAFPFVKHQLGLEAPYQDDCSVGGTVINNQPDLVKRHPGGGTARQLVDWCKPKMAGDAQNPVPQPDVDAVVAQGFEETLEFSQEIGMDYWSRGQFCVNGKPWDQYFREMKADPSKLWPRLRCSYTVSGVKRPLPCTSPGVLQSSLVTVLGCLDASGPQALPENVKLMQILQQKGQAALWLVPGTNAFDLMKLLVDDDGPFTPTNVDPAILALEKDGFVVATWLQALDRCTSETIAGGRLVDASLEIALNLGPDDFRPCGGACCENGKCRTVDTQSQCGGVFTPGATCATAGVCATKTEEPPRGACVVFGQCQEVASKDYCQGSTFYAGKRCSDIPGACEEGTCPAGTWCRPKDGGGKECVPWQPEGGSCGGFTLPWRQQRCADGVVCTRVSDIPDAAGVCRGTCIQPPSALAAWWRFDEAAGPVANESFGRNDGRHVNGPVVVTGMVGRAIGFDGINDYVEVANAPDLNFGTGDFTVAAWMRTTQSTGLQVVIDKRNRSPVIGYSVHLYEGRPGFQLADGAYSSYFATKSIADGAWHFVAVTIDRDRKDGVRFYIDGILDVTTGDPTRHLKSVTNASALRFGTRTLSNDGWWRGELDEPLLFNRALTAAEVMSIRNAGTQGFCRCDSRRPGALARWAFEEASPAKSIADSSGSGHTGVAFNSPWGIGGKVGFAMQFDGADDYIQVADRDGIDVGKSDFSIEAWISAGQVAGQKIIVTKRDATTGYALALKDGRLVLMLGDGVMTSFDSGVSIADGPWHHVVVTVQRASATGVRFFVDGKQAGAMFDPRPRAGSLSNAAPLRIATDTALPGSFWQGRLDELTLYRHALPASRIAWLYRSGMLGWCHAGKSSGTVD